jgi:hypothetical protein
VILDTAQDLGISLAGLSTDQQYSVVMRIIDTRRLYSLYGLLITIIIAAVAVVALLNSGDELVTENVGPVMLESGSTLPIRFDHKNDNPIRVTVTSIQADWTGKEDVLSTWKAEGRGDTPEVWFSLCSIHDDDNCRGTGSQRGIGGLAEKSLQRGEATVSFFNFRDNPPIVLTAQITH